MYKSHKPSKDCIAEAIAALNARVDELDELWQNATTKHSANMYLSYMDTVTTARNELLSFYKN